MRKPKTPTKPKADWRKLVREQTRKEEERHAIPAGRFSFTLPYPPSANEYWVPVPFFNPKKGAWDAKQSLSHKARTYKEAARLIALAAGVRPLRGDTFLHLKVYRPQRSGDVGNRLKVLEDALNGIAYLDDKQNADIHLQRFEDRGNPRVEVTVGTMDRMRSEEDGKR